MQRLRYTVCGVCHVDVVTHARCSLWNVRRARQRSLLRTGAVGSIVQNDVSHVARLVVADGDKVAKVSKATGVSFHNYHSFLWSRNRKTESNGAGKAEATSVIELVWCVVTREQ